MLFNTSQVLEGEAHALVFATGDRTLVGTIAKMASMPPQETTLQKEIKRFVRRLTTVERPDRQQVDQRPEEVDEHQLQVRFPDQIGFSAETARQLGQAAQEDFRIHIQADMGF